MLGGAAYRCNICDFDCCTKCFAKKSKAATTEGVLRGDKGMKREENVSNTSFVSRGPVKMKMHTGLPTLDVLGQTANAPQCGTFAAWFTW